MDPYLQRLDYQMALNVCQRLHQSGFLAYFAGGCVRDFLLGREAADFDVATSALPDQVISLFENTVQTGKQFGVIMVIEGQIAIEVTTFRTDGSYLDGRRPESVSFSNPYEDSARRDFTINSMFWDPIGKDIIDLHSGLQDLKDRVLRTVGDPDLRFKEDHLRILRLYRFQSQLGFIVEDRTNSSAQKLFPLVQSVAKERIVVELEKMGCGPGAKASLLTVVGLDFFAPDKFDLMGEWPVKDENHFWAQLVWSLSFANQWSWGQVENWLANWPLSKAKIAFIKDFNYYFFHRTLLGLDQVDLDFFSRLYRPGGWQGFKIFLWPMLSPPDREKIEFFKSCHGQIPENLFKFSDIQKHLQSLNIDISTPKIIGDILKLAYLYQLQVILHSSYPVDESELRRLVLHKISKQVGHANL